MKTLQEIDKEIAAETKGKTAVDVLNHKVSVYGSYYEVAKQKILELKKYIAKKELECENRAKYIMLLEKELETLKNKMP